MEGFTVIVGVYNGYGRNSTLLALPGYCDCQTRT